MRHRVGQRRPQNAAVEEQHRAGDRRHAADHAGGLFAIMVGGMASIAGTVLFLYGSILRPALPDAVAHLLIASILSAPAALVVAFVMVPPQGAATGARLELKSEATGSMDAVTRGTLEGAQLLLNIVAMLVVFVALVSLVNFVL